MQRRLQNQTHLKKDVLHWTVEWIIHPMASATAATAASQVQSPRTVRIITINEDLALQDALQQHQAQLQIKSNALNNVQLLIQQVPLKTYAVVSTSVTLQEALRDRTVIEFPTIQVVPKERVSEFSIALQEVNNEEEEDANNDSTQSSALTSQISPNPKKILLEKGC